MEFWSNSSSAGTAESTLPGIKYSLLCIEWMRDWMCKLWDRCWIRAGECV